MAVDRTLLDESAAEDDDEVEDDVECPTCGDIDNGSVLIACIKCKRYL